MPSLFSLFVDLKANTADFVSGMSSASYAAKKTGRDIESSFSTLGGLAEKALAPLGQIGGEIGSSLSGIAEMAGRAGSSLATLGSVSIGGALAGVATAAVAGEAALAALAIKGSEVVESFALISQKTGISISDLQVFGAAGQTVGVSLEDVVTGMRKFDQVLTDTGRGTGPFQATLKALGITATDNKGALLQLADAFSQMEDGPRKAAIAVELLGRSGLNLIPILDKGRGGIEQFQAIVSNFGPTISAKAVAATDEWKISTLELSQAWDRVEVTLTENFLPALSQVAQALAADLADQGLVNAIKNLGIVAGGAIGVFDTLWSGIEQVWSSGVLFLEEIERPLVAIYAAAADTIALHFAQAWKDIKDGGADQASYLAQYEAKTRKLWSDNANFINGLGLPGSTGPQNGSGSSGAPKSARPSDEDSYKSLYEELAAGGKEQLALQQEQAKLATDVAGLMWKEAAAEEQKIASLKQIIALEQARAKIWEKIGARLGAGDLSHPTLAKGASFAAPTSGVFQERDANGNLGQPFIQPGTTSWSQLRTGSEAAGPTADQIKALPSFAQLGEGVTADQAAANQAIGSSMATAAAAMKDAQDQVSSFWAQFGNEASNTFGQIDEQYQTDFANFYDLLAQKKISQEDFDAISVQLEANRIESIAKLAEAQQEEAKKLNESVIGDPFASVGSKFKAMANEISLEGENLGTKLFSSMSTAVDGMSSALAKFAVTGKNTFSEVFQSLAESIAKAEIQNEFGQIAGAISGKGGLPGSSPNAPGGTPGIVSGSLGLAGTIGKALGLGGKGPGGAADGSQANPFYVVASSGALGGALPSSGFKFGGLSTLFGGGGSDSGGGDSGSSGGGFLSSLFGFGKHLLSIFGGGLATGGDMDPGKAYLVGEQGPELMFAGSRGGSIAPITKSRGGQTIHNHLHIQTNDADSFGRSSSQIMAQMHRATQTALARNG